MELAQPPIFAVIVAGGQGTRMGTAIPKQFLDLNGHSVLYHTIYAFVEAIPDAHIVLVLPAHQLSYAQIVLQSFPNRIDLTLVSGGETRFQSVCNGIRDIPDHAIILVHDGVRPLISKKLIQRCLLEALIHGSAIPVISVVDSMRELGENNTSFPVNREKLRIVQTPQTFRASILIPSMQQAYQESFTDEATVVEAWGEKIHLVEGERNNIKITTPDDLRFAQALLNEKET
ncbi:MAG: 2-C-methyl-D-erythritol 4-phosphate cytidylyltransferase [Bacteroidetes bacterium]|nr:2-C-methyl-D-erythritol 4-phosphate cytidylyltransferase [Bacteroidota bacterium]